MADHTQCNQVATKWITFDRSPDGYTVGCDKHAACLADMDDGPHPISDYTSEDGEYCCHISGQDCSCKQAVR